jgi:CRP-like cAMP-binding protein
MQRHSVQQLYNNRVLACLTEADLNRLAPHLSPIELPMKHPLHSPGKAPGDVYFLEDGVCSIVASMENGITVEVGIIGRDGFIGTAVALGTSHLPNRCFMQIPGHGFSIKSSILIQHIQESRQLHLLLLRSVHGLLVQTAQTAACNRVHELHKRLARWLLMCYDRVQVDRVPITQEFLAMMLGTRRSTVTVAAGILQKSGLIAFTRGHVTIKNHVGLVEAACECYQVVHDEYVRLNLL